MGQKVNLNRPEMSFYYRKANSKQICSKELQQILIYLAGKEMPTDFHKDLVVLIWGLVPRHYDLCAGEVLQLVDLRQIHRNS